MLELLERLLRGVECEILLADDGSIALILIEKQAVDLVTTHRRMPGPDGPKLLDGLRSRFLAVETIVISNLGSMDDASETDTNVGLDCIHEPIPMKVLSEKFRSVLEGKREVQAAS